MALPSVTSAPSSTIVPRKLFVEITPDGGATFTMLARTISGGPNKEDTERESVTSDGKMLFIDRRVPLRRNDSFTITVDEYPSALISLITGNTNLATARIFAVDPDDGTNVAAWSVTKAGGVTAFNCLVTKEGTFDFNREEVSTFDFMIKPTEAVVYNIDATI